MNNKITALEKEIESLKKQWPAHSVSPALLQRLDDLEEALDAALSEQAKRSEKASRPPKPEAQR